MKITHHVTVVSPGHSSTESLMAPVSLPYVPGIFDTPDDARHVRVENRTREVRPVIVRTVPARPVDEDACRKKLAELARAENAAMRKAFGPTKWPNPEISATARASSEKGGRVRREAGIELRVQIMALIGTPMTCEAIAAAIGKTAGSVAHHLHTLRDHGLARVVGRGEQQRKLWWLA